MYTHSNDEASTPIVTYHHSKYTTINDHHHHLLSDNEEGSFRFFVPSGGDENDNNGNNNKSRLMRNCCCCCPFSPTNQWCYHLVITLVIGSVLILFTTIVAYASVHFLHANLQCSHVELANSDSETIHFAQFASRVKKLTIQSNGITKTFMKRSSSTNSLSKRNVFNNNNHMNVKSIDDDDDDERLLITVSRYSQSSDGFKRLNTSLIFNEETGHLILDSHVPNDLLKNDCVYVERTVSIPMNFLSSSSSSNNNGDGSGPMLDIEFPPGIGDVEFVRLEDDDDNKKKNKESDGAEDDDYTFSFKSLTIERHSGDIIMDSVYCSDIVNVSTHHGDIHMYSVAAQKRGIVMNVVSIGDVLYEDLFAPVVNASVQTGDIKGQFIYGLPTLQQVNFLTSTGSQSHSRIVNVNSTQSYVTSNGNIKMVMKPYEFEGNFDITSGKRGSVVVNHFNKDQITYTVNSKSSKQGTIQFGTSAHQQNTSPRSSSLQIAVLKKGNVNVMLDV